ncbi:broad-complex core protein isoform X4 [Leptinotarsa decemlineata]|uniref:broad-complex core protein isoform X4 n=1 Tax=Leptinotarsa decemlineata TaxID=7539 RepID=UPI000C2531D6|nr:broad-complex core protein isoforms 1/2/3/4/5 isoform X4 [Leptinotarsa decemlineata]XP_023021246.1 broad-complex core protein isoforms 1/2/3/4/5 isoform X4 [Leptinotarsa decemlineata]XP_023021247.1 broad-complex core protein isoforms 1/2/3/4/5 isoform X4 [Leptinotarsa decemlineata]
MVDTQHFCLRWNNYQSSITSAFENLRDDEDFVDVTLACDGKSLKAHRVVLSACSPYFRELLKSTPCKHPVIVLQDVAWTDLHALVEFIYHGEVNVHQRSLSSFLKTAEVLRVSGLTQQHGDGRDQLAQVQSMVRSQQHSTPVSNHHPTFTEKLVEDALFTSPSSPPHGATVNQLLRRAAMQYRRERRISIDPENDHKRVRAEHIIGNNNNNELNLSTHTHPPQTQPADFSPSAMKNNVLNLNLNSMKNEIEGNGISSTERENSPCSPSPTTLHSRCTNDNNENVKNEPMELLCGTNQDGDSNDSTDMTNEHGPNNLPQGPHSGSSGGDHDDHDSAISPYLTPESKLFATAAGSFNFSMAALAGDPTSLGGLNQSLQGNDSLAGTSQGASPKKVFTCQLCGKVLCSKASLKRHIADKHAERQEEYRCVICERVYCSRNSLMTHIYTYHKSRPGDIDIKFF